VLHGDLATFPLAELLQWLDQSRRAGVLEVEAGGAPFWMEIHDRHVVACARPTEDGKGLGSLARWQPTEGHEALWPETSADRIVDLFLTAGQGRFTFGDGAAGFDGGVPLALGLGQVTLEGLRRLDEWPALDQRHPSEASLLSAGAPPASVQPRTAMQRAIVEAARRGLSLGEARLALGLSRPAMLRRTEALRELGLVQVEGATAEADPVARLVDQAQALVAERQFEEAAIVLRSLLAADPSDRRVRTLLGEAEREQLASLYAELSPVAVPVLAAPAPPGGDAAAARRLTSADQEVLTRVNGRWDVASIALACPLREVETLKSLRKLVRLGLVALRA
jgi:hypothetical protein